MAKKVLDAKHYAEKLGIDKPKEVETLKNALTIKRRGLCNLELHSPLPREAARAFRQSGYLFLKPEQYLLNPTGLPFGKAAKLFTALGEDPTCSMRKRSKIRFIIERIQNGWSVNELNHVAYAQSDTTNYIDGNKSRDFADTPAELFRDSEVQEFIAAMVGLCLQCTGKSPESVIFNLHCVAYMTSPDEVSYGSPTWNHTDSEEYVAVTSAGVSSNVDGGANIIFNEDGESGIPIVQKRLIIGDETLIMGKGCPHAVTPVTTSDANIATRLVTFFTIENTEDILKNLVSSAANDC